MLSEYLKKECYLELFLVKLYFYQSSRLPLDSLCLNFLLKQYWLHLVISFYINFFYLICNAARSNNRVYPKFDCYITRFDGFSFILSNACTYFLGFYFSY
jgi:hypothetical protein